MDIETRLRKLESDLHRTKVRLWTAMAVVLCLLGLILLQVQVSGELVISILVFLALAVLAYLLVRLASGVRLFCTRRAADAQLQDKIMTDFLAERARTQPPENGLR